MRSVTDDERSVTRGPVLQAKLGRWVRGSISPSATFIMLKNEGSTSQLISQRDTTVSSVQEVSSRSSDVSPWRPFPGQCEVLVEFLERGIVKLDVFSVEFFCIFFNSVSLWCVCVSLRARLRSFSGYLLTHSWHRILYKKPFCSAFASSFLLMEGRGRHAESYIAQKLCRRCTQLGLCTAPHYNSQFHGESQL